MDNARSSLDLDRFGKVWAFAEAIPHGQDNAHERDAARGRAETMARAHGLSLDEAVACLRRSRGESGAAFPLDDLEQMIDAAGVNPRTYSLDETLQLYRILMRAIPFPETIRAAVAEFDRWDAIKAERVKREPSYRLGKAAAVRRSMMATFISDKGATSIAEAVARAAWVNAQLWRPGRFGFQEKRAVQTMAADMARMGERITTLTRKGSGQPKRPEHPLRRTGTMKRADIVSILDGEGGDRLTLREVAERAGVSPETVRKIRRGRARP